MNKVWQLITDLSNKRGITEIAINGEDSVFVERDDEFIGLNVKLPLKDLFEFADEVAKQNKQVCDEENPIFDGILPDGSRINIIRKPFVKSDIAITIRKYAAKSMSLINGAELFNINPRWIPFFSTIVKTKANIIVSGGTGIGKTTFLNMMLNEISPDERIITIEDTLELSFNRKNYVSLESGAKISTKKVTLTTSDLVRNSLRMKPERIFIGEIRGPEIFDLLQAMNTGHEGSMTSIHANSSVEALTRLETLYLMGGFDVPITVVRSHISQAVDYIIQLGKDREGCRCVKKVIEVGNMEAGNILTTTILDYDSELNFTGVVPGNFNQLVEEGILERDFFS